MLISGCGGTVTPEWKQPDSNIPGLYLVNEGLMGTVNSSELMVVGNDSTVWRHWYVGISGEYLGDVPNFLTRSGNYLYIVVTNSHVIRVVDLSIPEKIADIELPGKYPREMLIVDENLAYVSCSDGTVAKIDLRNKRFITAYSVGKYPEGMALEGDDLFVACSGWGTDHRIFVLDAVTGEERKILYAEKNVVSLVVADHKLYAGAVGGWGNLSDQPWLQIFDTRTFEKIDSVAIDYSATSLQIYDGHLFLNNGSILRLSLSDIHARPQVVAEDTDNIIYGFLVTESGEMWLAKYPRINYASEGTLEKRTVSGDVLGVYQAGIGPRAMLFVGE